VTKPAQSLRRHSDRPRTTLHLQVKARGAHSELPSNPHWKPIAMFECYPLAPYTYPAIISGWRMAQTRRMGNRNQRADSLKAPRFSPYRTMFASLRNWLFCSLRRRAQTDRRGGNSAEGALRPAKEVGSAVRWIPPIDCSRCSECFGGRTGRCSAGGESQRYCCRRTWPRDPEKPL
jgi:hypothetical protein